MRRSLPEICLDHPIGTLALAAAFIVAGVASVVRLPIALMPDLVYPMVRVQVTSGQTPPEVLANTVTRILEQQLSQVEGLDQIESSTEQGRVQITLSLAMDRDIDAALRETSAWVDRAKAQLPPDIDPPLIFKFDPQNLPVLELIMSSETMDPVALRQLAETDLSYRFVGTEGVAAVRVAGGRQREIQVRINPAKLHSRGLTLQDLTQALRSDNVQRPSGRVDAGGKELFGQVLSLFDSPREISDVQVAAPNGDRVALREVAEVVDTHAEQRLIVFVNGHEAVKLSVFKAPQANSVATAGALRARLDELKAARVIPADVSVAVSNDESIYISHSIENARHALLTAVALVALVVLLFLANWRYTLLSMAVVLAAMLVTTLMMRMLGLSLNLMSIGGLIVGVGLLVDYGIVLLENIARHRTSAGDLREAVAAAAREVASPLIASVTILVAAVSPFLLLGGLTMLFFKEFILTIIFATVAGLLTAFALVPSVFPLADRSARHDHVGEGRVMKAVTAVYRRMLIATIRHAHWAVAGAFACLFWAVLAMTQLGYVFLPDIDNGQVAVTGQGEPGMLLDEFRTEMMRVAELARVRNEVQLVDATIGGRIGQTIQVTPATAEMLVQLVPKSQREQPVQEWVSSFARTVDGLDLAGVKVSVRKARMRAIRTFTGSAAQDFDIVVVLEGQDTGTLAKLGEEAKERLSEIAGLADVDTTLIVNQPMVDFSINRDRAAVFGVAPATITDALQAAIDGLVPSRFFDRGFYHDIRLQLKREDVHGRLHGLNRLPVARLSGGNVLLLGQVADVRLNKGPLSIDRINQTAVNLVTGSVRGRTVGEAASDVRRSFGSFPLPAGFHVSYGGRMAVLSGQGSGAMWVGLLALFLVLVVLAVQYESLLTPAVVVAVLPLGVIGAAGALWLTGTPLSATAIIGLVLIAGIAGNNAVVLVAFIEQLRQSGQGLADAAVLGATLRLRPKLMTALVAIVALVPLATGSQEGGEILQPLAVVVLGGVPVSLLGTLLILPALYVLVQRPFVGSAVARAATPKIDSAVAGNTRTTAQN